MAKKLINFCALLFLGACASSLNSWRVDGIDAGNGSYDLARLRYVPSLSHSPLTFEFLKLKENVEAFLSLSHFRFNPIDSDNNAKVIFTISNRVKEILVPIHEGQMRVRLPKETTEEIIQALQEGKKVAILLDGFEETLDPEQFSSSFAQFLGQGNFLQTLFKGPL